MLKAFPIEFIRQILEQTLYIEHLKDINMFGGKNQINIFSFYEQLKNQDEVDRFVETYRDLTDQQNRTGLIGNGVIVSPENPTITNLYSSLIIPFAWTCSIRCTLADRDQMLITLNNLIKELKGRKVDVAQLDCVDENDHLCAKPFVVGTIGENDNAPILQDGDYVGKIDSVSDKDIIIANLTANGIELDITKDYYVYCTNNNELKVARLYFYGGFSTWAYEILEDDGTIDRIIFPPTHTSFEKFKVSMSFDSLRCDEPRTLNSEEYCEISFGGSCTLVNDKVAFGNDLIKIGVVRKEIKAETPITYTDQTIQYLEPLELPSGNDANTQISQLASNNFKTNSHTDGIGVTIQYSFIADFSFDLIKEWFDYARYGNIELDNDNKPIVSPNIIYEISEFWSSWGTIKNKKYLGKIVDKIDIENTESDTLTLGVVMQIQGEN